MANVDLGEKMTSLENRIYNTVVSMLQQEEVPSTVGRVIVGNVYRHFVESAYYVATRRIELLEQERAKAKQSGEDKVAE